MEDENASVFRTSLRICWMVMDVPFWHDIDVPTPSRCKVLAKYVMGVLVKNWRDGRSSIRRQFVSVGHSRDLVPMRWVCSGLGTRCMHIRPACHATHARPASYGCVSARAVGVAHAERTQDSSQGTKSSVRSRACTICRGLHDLPEWSARCGLVSGPPYRSICLDT